MAGKQFPIPGIDGAFYYVGPVKLSLVARIELNIGAEVALTTDFQDATDLLNGRQRWQCSEGGRAGIGNAFVEAKLVMGGNADILVFRAQLGTHAIQQ